jgi:hypothetical protein
MKFLLIILIGKVLSLTDQQDNNNILDNMISNNIDVPFLKVENEELPLSSIFIESVETKINLIEDSSDATIYEIVHFTLTNGIFDTLIRKISLGGTASHFHTFKISSTDIELIDAHVTNNCYDGNPNHYICLIVNFKPLNLTSIVYLYR